MVTCEQEEMESKPPPNKKRRLSNSTMSTTIQEPSKDLVDNDTNPPQTFSRGLSQAEREIEVGILHFVNTSNPGFSGTLKKRYTDFIVNEVSVDGKVLHLTDLGVPRKGSAKPKPTSSSVQPYNNTSTITASTNVALSSSLPSSSITKSPREDKLATMANATAQPNPQPPVATTTNTSPEAVKVSFTISSEDDALLVGRFGRSVADDIITLHQKILSKPNAKPSTFGFVMTEPVLEKSTRGAIHSDVRRIFESRLETVFQEQNKAIKVTAAAPSSRKPNRQPRTPGNDLNGKLGWDHLGGEFLHCVLFKENKDTMEVVNQLARSIGCKPKDIATSGTKDRRAVTTQGISIYRQKPETMKRAAFNLYNVAVGNFTYKKLPLELGELGGNEFTITLRDVDILEINLGDKFEKLAAASAIISQAMDSLHQTGFINYFGLQRFGSHAIGTEVIGKMILKGDFRGAVFAGILECGNKDVSLPAYYSNVMKADKVNPSVSEDDMKRYRAINKALTEKKYKEALEMLPRRFVAETAVLRHLMHDEKDVLGALKAIPHTLQTMYVHAYQSLVWNHVASERYARYGTKIVEGDLVLINAKTRHSPNPPQDEFDEHGEVIVRPAAHDASVTHDDIFDRARPLLAEEAESGKYTIFDVVLPTPGYDIEYPANEIGDFYKKFMASEQGGGLDPANMRRQQKTFSLSGSYRHYMGSVGIDMSVDYHLYVNENEQFVETDLEKLVKEKKGGQGVQNRNMQGLHKGTDSNASSGGNFVPKDSPHLRWTPKNGLEEISATSLTELQETPSAEASSDDQVQNLMTSNGSHYEDLKSSASPTYQKQRIREYQLGVPLATPNNQINHTRGRQLGRPSVNPSHQINRNRVSASNEAPGLWGQAVAMVQADDKAKIASYEAEHQARLASGYAFTGPILAHTWIEKSAENEGKPTGRRTTTIHGDKQNQETMMNTAESTIIDGVEKVGDHKETQEVKMANAELTVVAEIKQTGENKENQEAKMDIDEPAIIKEVEQTCVDKVAAIVRFSLAPSTYATMALREVSRGGIQAYQPTNA